MKRRQFLALSIVSASGLVAGCNGGVGPITDKWLADGQYEETLKAFLITQDGKKLVVLGERYHYIFDLPPALYKVMTSSYRPKLHTEFRDFVAQGDKISGRYKLELKRKDAPPNSDVRAQALADGFKDDNRFTESGTISGTRYMPRPLDGATIPQAFNAAYEVHVTEKPTPAGKAVKLALSPITVAADGGLYLAAAAGAVVIAPIALVFVILIMKHYS